MKFGRITYADDEIQTASRISIWLPFSKPEVHVYISRRFRYLVKIWFANRLKSSLITNPIKPEIDSFITLKIDMTL